MYLSPGSVGLKADVVSGFRPRRVVNEKKSSRIKVSTREPRVTSNQGSAALIVPRYDHVWAVPCTDADLAWESPAIGLGTGGSITPPS